MRSRRAPAQTHRGAKRAAWASPAADSRSWTATPGRRPGRRCFARLRGLNVNCIQRVRLADRQGLELLGQGIAAGVGVAAGPIALDAAALERLGQARNRAILVREDVSTDDIAAIATAAGVLTAHGTRTAHAAVVARTLEKPCIVGCSALAIDFEARTVRIGTSSLAEGETICLDAQSGEVFRGSPHVVTERPTELLGVLERWRTLPPAAD